MANTEKIEAIQILELFSKAQELGANTSIYKKEYGYSIRIYWDWHDDNNFYEKSVIVTNEGESNWNTGDYDVQTMCNILDEELELKKQREIKARKRKQLIESFTPEQRELLGL